MRKAASMIELVIAIVVMGISVSALPMILTQSQKSNALSLQQEVIMATKSKLAYILSYEWDENSYDENASVSRVLETNTTTGAASAFNRVNGTRRIGHVVADNRRRLWDTTATMRFPVVDTNSSDDMDDFNGVEENTTIASETMDYIFTVRLLPTIFYVNDGSTLNYNAPNITLDFNTTTIGGPTNIKMIQITTTGPDINTTLRAFSCNIGESTIAKRQWQ